MNPDASSHPLDRATRLEGTVGDAVRRGHTSTDYWNFIGPFGGTSAATALRAVVEHPHRLGDPVAATVNFCAPIAEGGFDVHARVVRTNRSSQHWSVEIVQGGNEPVLTSSVVTAVRRDSWRHQPAAPPALPDAASLAPFDARASLAWVGQYEMRFVEGGTILTDAIPDPPASARSVLWIRDVQPRTLDFVSLMTMSDAFFGRIFQVQGRLPPFGTISMTTHFHASGEELAAHGSERLAGLADARVFHRGFCDQTVELYGRGGQLLATSMQTAYFRA